MAQLFVADDLFAWRATVTLVPRVRIQPDIHRGDTCIFRDKGATVFKKWANSGLFYIYFSLFIHILIFYNK